MSNRIESMACDRDDAHIAVDLRDLGLSLVALRLIDTGWFFVLMRLATASRRTC
jgi:hypothetical protein